MEFFPHDMICIAYRMIPTTMVGSVISMWGGFFFFWLMNVGSVLVIWECFFFFFFVARVFFLKRSGVSNVGRNLFMREFTILTHFDWFRLIKLEVFLTVKKKKFPNSLNIYKYIYIYI